MLNPRDVDFAAGLSRTDREVFRFLQSLSDSGDTKSLISKIERSLDLFEGFSLTVPGMKELLVSYQQWRILATAKPSDAVRWMVFDAPMTPEIRAVAGAIRSAYKVVSKWGAEFVDTVQRLRVAGVIQPETANPNTESPRYEVAVDVAGLLAKYWFIRRVVLFGSVAKGTDSDTSDVDLLVEPVISTARVKHEIGWISQEAKERTGVEANITVKSHKMTRSTQAFFQKAGFYDASVVLFERTDWLLTCCGETHVYAADRLLGTSYVWDWPLLLFKAGKKRAQAVLLSRDDSTEAIGIIRGISSFLPGRVWPRWVTPWPDTDRDTDLEIYHGLAAIKDKGQLLGMEPWLVYA